MEQKQNPSTNEEGFKKVTNIKKQGKKNPTVGKSLIPSTSNSFGVLESQHDEPVKGEEGSPPSSKRPHQESQKGKQMDELSQFVNNDAIKQSQQSKERIHE